MARGDPQLTSFNLGEVSPRLRARVDFERFPHGASLCENFVPTVEGPLCRRLGTQYVGQPKNGGILIPFEASTSDGFILEIGDGYMRFWHARTRLPVMDNGTTWSPYVGGAPAELATPWSGSSLYLTTPQGDTEAVALQWAQSNDVMWIVHPRYFPIKLMRIDTYKFAWQYTSDGLNVPVPFKDAIPGSITLTAGAKSGATTLTASAAYFTAAMVGEYIYLEQSAATPVAPWEVAKAVVANDVRSSNGRNYVALNNATTGTQRPVHSTGDRSDGAVAWRWNDDGYGVAIITGYTSPTLVNVTIAGFLPDSLTTTATNRFARQAWNVTDGYPNAVAFYLNRLCYGRGQTMWGSVVGDYENHKFQNPLNVVTDDLAMTFDLAAERNDRILWMCGSSALIAGTAGGEWAVSAQSTQDPFGPANVRAIKHAGYGSRASMPVKVADSLLYMQRGGYRVRELSYDYPNDAWKSEDRSLYASHLAPRFGFFSLAHQRQPDSVVWVTSVTGRLFSLTYDRVQQVYGWSRHLLGGPPEAGDGALVSQVCAITGPDGVSDDLWMMTRRFTVGGTKSYLEVLGPAKDLTLSGYYAYDIPDTANANYLDCGTTGTLTAGSAAIPAGPLKDGTTATVLIEGQVIPDITVAGGFVTIPAASVDNVYARRYRVGYNYISNWMSLRLIGQSATGSPQGKLSKVTKAVLAVFDSVGFKVGTSADNLYRTDMRDATMIFDEAVPLQTGDFEAALESSHDRVPYLYIRQDQPLPLNVGAVFPQLEVQP